MGLIRDRNGMWCVQRKVPERLQIAVARVLNNGKRKQVHLKKSLGTRDLKAANVRATSVIAGFDRIFASAALLSVKAAAPPQQRQSLNGAEIARMAEALYGKLLADDEAFRFGGRAFVADGVEWIRRNEEPDFAALLFRHKMPGLHNIISADWEAVFEMNFRTITRARKKIISDRDDLFFVKTITDRVAEVEGRTPQRIVTKPRHPRTCR
jgi:hypothetical protein